MSSPSPSSTPPPSSTSQVVTSSSSTSSGSNLMGISNNTTLYIYTFLAALVLLLSVSSAIVIRSLILRRRHHRLVEEAIRAGTWAPNTFDPVTGRRRRDFGEKPKLWEAWIHSGDDNESDANEKSKWSDIMPIYAAHFNQTTSLSQGLAGPAEQSSNPKSAMYRLLRPFTRRPSPPPPPPQPSTVLPETPETRSLSPPSPFSSPSPSVRVAVLIAMPSLSPKPHSDGCGTPVLEIGVIETGVKDADDASSSRDGS